MNKQTTNDFRINCLGASISHRLQYHLDQLTSNPEYHKACYTKQLAEFKGTILNIIDELFRTTYAINGLGDWYQEFKDKVYEALKRINLDDIGCKCSEIFDYTDIDVLVTHIVTNVINKNNINPKCISCVYNTIVNGTCHKTKKRICYYFSYSTVNFRSPELTSIFTRNIEKFIENNQRKTKNRKEKIR